MRAVRLPCHDFLSNALTHEMLFLARAQSHHSGNQVRVTDFRKGPLHLCFYISSYAVPVFSMRFDAVAGASFGLAPLRAILNNDFD